LQEYRPGVLHHEFGRGIVERLQFFLEDGLGLTEFRESTIEIRKTIDIVLVFPTDFGIVFVGGVQDVHGGVCCTRVE